MFPGQALLVTLSRLEAQLLHNMLFFVGIFPQAALAVSCLGRGHQHNDRLAGEEAQRGNHGRVRAAVNGNGQVAMCIEQRSGM